ncbi:hypothetical protein BC629DRAFT_1437861 [Irpex lacteus]|nr:hypothetical protein BC629DRAFT_1437861 [Irpex lacteus]
MSLIYRAYGLEASYPRTWMAALVQVRIHDDGHKKLYIAARLGYKLPYWDLLPNHNIRRRRPPTLATTNVDITSRKRDVCTLASRPSHRRLLVQSAVEYRSSIARDLGVVSEPAVFTLAIVRRLTHEPSKNTYSLLYSGALVNTTYPTAVQHLRDLEYHQGYI